MRELITNAFEFFHPIIEFPAVQERLRFVEENFFPFTASLALLATFVMWANI